MFGRVSTVLCLGGEGSILFGMVDIVLSLGVQALSCVWECNDCFIFGGVSMVLCLGGWTLSSIWEGGFCPEFWSVGIGCYHLKI